jgi:hypothetical protein
MTPDLSTYTTSELERLVTLTCATAATEDYINFCNAIYRRTVIDANAVGALVTQAGRCTMAGNNFTPVRRVRSFTDLTEVDPSVDSMKAELERRRAPRLTFRKGDSVVFQPASADLWLFKAGHIGTVDADCPEGDNHTKCTMDTRKGIQQLAPCFYTNELRLATARDIQVYEQSLLPQPLPGQVYRHRETTDADPFRGGQNSLYRYEGGVVWSYKHVDMPSFKEISGDGSHYTKQVQDGTRVPYTPPVISNATHAGRRVMTQAVIPSSTGIYHPPQPGRVVDERAKLVAFTAWDGIVDRYNHAVTVVALDSGAVVGIPPHMLTLLD